MRKVRQIVLYFIWNCVVIHGIMWYFFVLTCIDTIEVILSDWRDTGAETTDNLKKLQLYTKASYFLAYSIVDNLILWIGNVLLQIGFLPPSVHARVGLVPSQKKKTKKGDLDQLVAH